MIPRVYPPVNFYSGTNASSPVIDITGVRAPLRSQDTNIMVTNSLGERVTVIDNDPALTNSASTAVPTQSAVVGYVAAELSNVVVGVDPVYALNNVVSLRNDSLTTITAVSTDATLSGSSDEALPTQRAVKLYVDAKVASVDDLTALPPVNLVNEAIYLTNDLSEGVTAISTDPQLSEDSNSVLPTQAAVKAYVDDSIDDIPAVTGTAPVVVVSGDVSLANSSAEMVTSISTDTTLAENSDAVIPTQRAVRTYTDTRFAHINGSMPINSLRTGTDVTLSLVNALGTPVNLISTSVTLPAPSNSTIPTQAAVKSYVDSQVNSITTAAPLTMVGKQICLLNNMGGQVTSISTDISFGNNDDYTVPTQRAAKAYADIVSSAVAIQWSSGLITLVRDDVAGTFTFAYNDVAVLTISDSAGTYSPTARLVVSNTENADAVGTGALRVSGGASVTRTLYVGEDIVLSNGTTSPQVKFVGSGGQWKVTSLASGQLAVHYYETERFQFADAYTKCCTPLHLRLTSPHIEWQGRDSTWRIGMDEDVTPALLFTHGGSSRLTIDDTRIESRVPMRLLSATPTLEFGMPAGTSTNAIVLGANNNLLISVPRYAALPLFGLLKVQAGTAPYEDIPGTTYSGYKFSGSADVHTQSSASMPYDMGNSSTLTLVMRMVQVGIMAGTSTWQVRYQIVSPGSAVAASTGDAVVNVNYGHTAATLRYNTFTMVSGAAASYTPDMLLLFSVERLGSSDSYSGDVYMVGLDLVYQCGRIGGGSAIL